MADNRKKSSASPPSIEPPGQSFPDFHSIVSEAKTVEHEALPTVRRQLEYTGGGSSQVGAEDESFGQVSFFEAQVQARRVDIAVQNRGGISISLPKINLARGKAAPEGPKTEEEMELAQFAHDQEATSQAPRPSTTAQAAKQPSPAKGGGLFGMFSLPFGKKTSAPPLQSITQIPPPGIPEPSAIADSSQSDRVQSALPPVIQTNLPEQYANPPATPSVPKPSMQPLPKPSVPPAIPQLPSTKPTLQTERDSDAIDSMPTQPQTRPMIPPRVQPYSSSSSRPYSPQIPQLPSSSTVTPRQRDETETESPVASLPKSPSVPKQQVKERKMPQMPRMHHDSPLIRPIASLDAGHSGERTMRPDSEMAEGAPGEPDDGDSEKSDSDIPQPDEIQPSAPISPVEKEETASDENEGKEEEIPESGLIYRHEGEGAPPEAKPFANEDKESGGKVISEELANANLPAAIAKSGKSPKAKGGRKKSPAKMVEIEDAPIAASGAEEGKMTAIKGRSAKGRKSQIGTEAKKPAAKGRGGKKAKAARLRESVPQEMEAAPQISEGISPQEEIVPQQPDESVEAYAPAAPIPSGAPQTKSGRLISKLRSMQAIAPKIKSALKAEEGKKTAMPSEDEIRKIEEKASLYPIPKSPFSEKPSAADSGASNFVEDEIRKTVGAQGHESEPRQIAEGNATRGAAPPSHGSSKMPVSSKRVFPRAPMRHLDEESAPAPENASSDSDDDGGSGGAPAISAHPTFKGSRVFPSRKTNAQDDEPGALAPSQESPVSEGGEAHGVLREQVREKAKSIFPAELAQVASKKNPVPPREEEIVFGESDSSESREENMDGGSESPETKEAPEAQGAPAEPQELPPQIRDRPMVPKAPPVMPPRLAQSPPAQPPSDAPTPSVSSQISTSAAPVLGVKPSSAEKAQGAAVLTDEIYFAYARERAKWIYEIYKIGGMTLDEFRSQIREKMALDAGKGPDNAAAPANPAFQNLNKELDKKFKK